MLFTVSGHIRNSIYTQQKQENNYNNSLRENAHRKFDAFVILKIDNGNYRGRYIVK